MSAAPDIAPVIRIPVPQRQPNPSGGAIILPFPVQPAALQSPPVRLTRRGVVVCALACAMVAAGLLALAWLTLASRSPAPTARPAVPQSVIVEPGDSLWSIAAVIAPGRDPRPVVDTLRRLNHLTGTDLLPGQRLRTR